MTADMTLSRYGRAACATCGRSISLLKSGRVRQHGREADVGRWASCSGSRQEPRPVVAPGHGWALKGKTIDTATTNGDLL